MNNEIREIPPLGVRGLFERDLNRLLSEIEAYSDESLLWKRAEGISNPAGNLALHLVGNLNTYIGKNLGGTDYVRDRPAEFASIVSKSDLIEKITTTKHIILKILLNLQTEDLHETYPEEVLGYPMTTEYFLTHLYGHLNYHLGQINYHRRLVK
jgi:uncharacterized damage-inducible protein DinB